MREYRFRSEDLVSKEPIPDTVLSDDDLHDLQQLAGIETKNITMPEADINISYTGMEKKKFEKENNIRPGTPDWFRLWFTLPYLTNTKPYDK